MKKEYRSGIEESRRVRVEGALTHLETMREDYVSIVRRRLADPHIDENKKLSVYAIAKELTALGHQAPRSNTAKDKSKAKVPYRVAKRLAQLVGQVVPLAMPSPEAPSAFKVGDRVRVVSPDRSFHGSHATIREVLKDGDEFHVQLDNSRTLKLVYAHEIRRFLK